MRSFVFFFLLVLLASVIADISEFRSPMVRALRERQRQRAFHGAFEETVWCFYSFFPLLFTLFCCPVPGLSGEHTTLDGKKLRHDRRMVHRGGITRLEVNAEIGGHVQSLDSHQHVRDFGCTHEAMYVRMAAGADEINVEHGSFLVSGHSSCDLFSEMPRGKGGKAIKEHWSGDHLLRTSRSPRS